MCTTRHFSSILELIHKCKKIEEKWGEMMNVGSSVLKTNAGMMRVVTERKGTIPQPVLRAMRVIFKIFIINTIKFRPLFWFFFFLYLNIQEHSLSNVRHQYYKERDTSREKQWKMLIKLKESLSTFFLSFFKSFF